MSIFDSILDITKAKYGLSSESSAGLLTSLLGIITNPKTGGVAGFTDLFKKAGLSSAFNSWVTGSDSVDLSAGDVERTLGRDTIDTVAAETGIARGTAVSALATMIPGVVNSLSPDGVMPNDDGIISSIKGFLSEWGGALGATILGGLGIAGAVAGGAVDKGREVLGNSVDAVGDAAGATYNKSKEVVGSGVNAVGDVLDGAGKAGGSILNWLLPLLLLGLLIALGFWFCGRTAAPVSNTHVNANVSNANRTNTNVNTTATALESSFSVKADNGKYTVSGVVADEATKKKIVDAMTAQYGAANVNFDGLKVDAKAKPFADGWWDNFGKMLPNLKDWKTGSLAFVGGAITEAVGLPGAALDQLKSLFSGWKMPDIGGAIARALGEVSLPDGAKLKAYTGGIEDQLIKFIQSDEYKNGTNETMKEKWFSFDDLNFEFGKTELTPESKRQMDNIVAILKAFPAVKLKIGAYTDKKGDDAANLKLSDSRAKAVQALLQKAGVGAQAPEAEGYGEKFATVDENADDKAREADRKTAIRLIK